MQQLLALKRVRQVAICAPKTSARMDSNCGMIEQHTLINGSKALVDGCLHTVRPT
jgi:hypothetical protein